MSRPGNLPEEWQVLDGKPMRGGQAIAVPVRHKDGRVGVFREPKTHMNVTGKRRLQRELEILSSKVQHRSIVNLYDWSDDIEQPWYISELGDEFEEWWRRKKREFGGNPRCLVEQAVSVIRDLSDALSVCHENGIVHRDIKTKNLVVKTGVPEPWPILIDFGLAYDEEGSRLTSADSAVGNRRFSPDVMRYRLDDVPPKLDVFELAQVLIWMLELKSPKSQWQRPVHWQYAKYDDEIPDELHMSILAFTAACSTEATSPADGSEVIELLNHLFPEQAIEHTGALDPNIIVNAKARAEARKLLRTVTIRDEIEAAAPLGEVVYQDLKETVLAALEEVSQQDPVARVLIDNGFHHEIVGATDLLAVSLGPENCNIELRIRAKVVTRSGTLVSNERNREILAKAYARRGDLLHIRSGGGCS